MQFEHLSSKMTSKSLVFVVLSSLVCLAVAENVHNKSDRSEFKKSLTKNCDDSYSLTCLKLDAVSWVDRLSENGDISVLPGVSLVREQNSAKANSADLVAEVGREFPDDPNARLDSYLMKKVSGFFDNHSIKLNLWKAVQAADSAGTARKGGGGGGGKKGGGDGMGMMLAAGAMMKGMMMAMALAGVAAIAGKALMTGLIALMLAAIVGLKGLSGGGGGHSTYEVIAKPVYTSSHSHSQSHEGWDGGYGHGRSLDNAPLPLALQPGFKPAQ